MEKLKEEVKTERFQRLAEQDRVIQSEQKRYTLERNCEKLQGQNLKLSVKLEELQMKYEPGKLDQISWVGEWIEQCVCFLTASYWIDLCSFGLSTCGLPYFHQNGQKLEITQFSRRLSNKYNAQLELKKVCRNILFFHYVIESHWESIVSVFRPLKKLN